MNKVMPITLARLQAQPSLMLKELVVSAATRCDAPQALKDIAAAAAEILTLRMAA